MSISSFFAEIGAPFVNNRWSWGAVRDDGAVVLRVWQNEKVRTDDKHYYQLTHHSLYIDRQDDKGYQERLSHIRAILAGSPCYLVMCRASNPDAIPRKIESFNTERVFEGGELMIVEDKEIYIEMVRPIPIVEFVGLHETAA